MPINLDFIGLNTFLNEPISSSGGQNVLGYPLGLDLSNYENVEVVRIASGSTSATNAVAARRRREGEAALFHVLNTKRNGPYGYSSWQQLRVSQNPLTRYHNKNSDFTFVTNRGETRGVLTDINKDVPRRDKYSAIRQFEEPPVTSKTFPLVWNVGAHERVGNDEFSLSRFSIKSSYGNYLLAFSNLEVNNELGTKISDDDLEYYMIKNMYISGGLDDEGSPITHWEFLKYRETIYPKAEYAFRKENRRRFNYTSSFKAKREDRTQFFLTNSFGFVGFDLAIVDGRADVYTPLNFSQSSWPLDVGEDFQQTPEHRIATLFTASGQSTSPSSHLPNQHTPYPHTDAEGNTQTSGPGVGGSGLLMNNYSQFAQNLLSPAGTVQLFNGSAVESSTYFILDNVMGRGPNYSRRHTLRETSSVSNPSGFANHRTGSSGHYNKNNIKFQGNARWQAGEMAGKQPFPNSYEEYSSLMRLKAKDYTVLPEFVISRHIRSIAESGSSFRPENMFEISGGESGNKDSSSPDFYKVYSTTDFLRHFDLINEHHEGFADSKVLTLRCKAIKKFLPYEGFYPCQRTAKLAEQFNSSYLDFVGRDNFQIFPGSNPLAKDYQSSDQPKQLLMTPLFSPGILFNTIKSGIACDFPMYTNGKTISANDSGSIYGDLGTALFNDSLFPLYVKTPDSLQSVLGANFNLTSITAKENSADDGGVDQTNSADHNVRTSQNPLGYRVPFEAMLSPERYLSQKTFRNLEPHASGNLSASIQWSGQGDDLYKLMANNFFAEVPSFFLKNQGFTSLVSKKQSEFKKVVADKKYSMRIKMYRSMDTKRLAVSSSNGIVYFPPQDIISASNSPRETFTMYSRPSAFGPPSLGVSGYYAYEDGNLDQVWYGDRIHITGSNSSAGRRNNIHMDSRHGFNFPYTPPYYHGEAWMDIHVSFSAGGIKSVSEIFEAVNKSISETTVHKPVDYFRATDVFARGHHLTTASYGYGPQSFYKNNINKNAMQLTASLNVFGEGALKSIDLLDDNSRQEVNLVVNTQEENEKRWVIQTKFETPMLNFNHLKDAGGTNSNITLPSVTGYDKAVVPVGMWHQYGRIPKVNEGVFLQVTDIPDPWVRSYEGAPDADYVAAGLFTTGEDYLPSRTGSLADLCGFSNEPIKLGQVAQEKEISEAVVAIPFVESNGRKSFFKLDADSVQVYLTPALKNTSKLGLSIKQQIDKMKRYVIPPNLDFTRNKTVSPIAMYIFEFKHILTQKDLSDIWQNLPPDSIANQYQESTAIISHPLIQKELLGSGVAGNNKNSEMPQQLRWMVFKVKKRAASNYFEKVFDKNSNLGETEFKRISKVAADAFGNTTDIQFNWPYDFFSLVELVKIDAEVEFNNVDYSNFEETLPEISTIQAKPRSIKKIDQNLDPNEFRVSLADSDAPTPIESAKEIFLEEIADSLEDEASNLVDTSEENVDNMQTQYQQEQEELVAEEIYQAQLVQLEEDFVDLQEDLEDKTGDDDVVTAMGPSGPGGAVVQDPDQINQSVNALNRPDVEDTFYN